LHKRRAPVTGKGMIGFECTIAVADIAAAGAAIANAGGTVTMQPMEIPGVGTLLMFEDTEGNTVGAMQYERGPR
jgi:hypothetical protein